MPSSLAARLLRSLAVAAGAVFLPGCIVFPFTTDVTSRISGRVEDAISHKPIRGAEIFAMRAQYHGFSRTTPRGAYDLGSLQQWHWIAYIGSPGDYPPSIFFSEDQRAPLVITAWAQGYHPLTKTFEIQDWVTPPNGVPVNFSLKPDAATRP
jgi:hypothetical protein